MVVWYYVPEVGDPHLIFIGGNSATSNPKYDNFKVITNTGGNQFNLRITEAEIEDQGIYSCDLSDPAQTKRARFMVEVAAVSLEIAKGSCAVTEIAVTEGNTSQITCKATGARPAVDIVWEPITSDIVQTNISTDGNNTFDTTSILSFTANRAQNGITLTCTTEGQQAASPKTTQASLRVRYPPSVTLVYRGNNIICSADAHPEVTKYVITIDNSDVYEPSCNGSECIFEYTAEVETPVKCNAINDIGTGTNDTVAIPDPPSVTVVYQGNYIICRADAHPQVTKYVIIIDNSDVYEPSCRGSECIFQYTAEVATPVRCNATNDIGTGTNDTTAIPDAIIPESTIPTSTEIPKLPGIALSLNVLNVSAACTPIPSDDDANIVIIVDGSPVAKDAEFILPSTGCLLIECIVTKGSLRNTKENKVCIDVDSAPPVHIAMIVAVAVPLALLAAAAIVFAIILILRSKQNLKETPDGDADLSGKNTTSGTTGQRIRQTYMELDARTLERATAYEEPIGLDDATGPSIPQTYMELDARTRERATAYEEPVRLDDETSQPYDDVAENVKSEDRVYQEIGNNSKNVEQLKEYVNVRPTNKAKHARRK